ncbi:MAG: helix-turn-helix transcriptional regulator [Clostridia bacterium]|nr:helix-turn-helix transcriptional regulator [Clostridia bacterium]
MYTLDKIKQLLKEQNKSQKDLTDYLGLKKSTFTSWNAGLNTSYNKHIGRIAEFLDVSTDYLLGNTDERKPINHDITDDDIKFALFEGADNITDEMYDEVKEFAKFVKNKYKKD